jgi:hypothetical protein
MPDAYIYVNSVDQSLSHRNLPGLPAHQREKLAGPQDTCPKASDKLARLARGGIAGHVFTGWQPQALPGHHAYIARASAYGVLACDRR